VRRVGGQGSRIRLSYGGHRSQTGDLWLPDEVVAGAARGGLGGGAAMRLLGGPPAQRPERYAAASPAALLPLGVTQVMVHGQEDPTVPVSMSEAYVTRAVAAGDDATLVVLPGVGHFELIDPATAAWATT
jgi:pimeloyl-ACP methyl ester carboxylesterase